MKNKTRYNKLVRDKIPEYIKNHGVIPITHIAEDEEYWQKLKEKLLEEVQEFNEDETLEELADILEVIDAIVAYKQFSPQEIRDTKEKKASKRGTFKDRIILDES